ncbi:hypothetical protein LEP1GSC060_2338 [Leptospira weilii serovar Ranarum str. ICFT]|uniref:Uncharacterized protein n=1 Tax=Leptospira weilii serovar Ranarum str. ICFT TaxID=1218598 RepID=N1WQN4_9LEPT|nr:hypothetical protein LEP1GSC060_2338 [Leptospira weilii serovar Ranarum str. ICFT]
MNIQKIRFDFRFLIQRNSKKFLKNTLFEISLPFSVFY